MGDESVLRVNGVDLCVETFGHPRDATILLVSGMSSSMDWWEDGLCERLAAGGRHVVRYDFRDTGRSTTYPVGAPDYTGADLRADVVEPGCGATIDGASVRAESIRRLACEADLIPMVLGPAGEVLDQGPRRRLVTPGQRVRLAVRDRGCTIPGCTVPATWCDAHHVTPWSHGGRSDLSNYALLCPRHHTWVHDRGLTATITALGVIWHL